MKVLNLVFAFVVLQSCGSGKDNSTTTETFWVSGIKTLCNAGAGKAQCLDIYKGDHLENATWEHFYAPIEGFIFEKGTFQKISVQVKQLEKEKVPADASSLKYTLVKVMERKPDNRQLMEGNWTLMRLNNTPLNKMVVVPTMMINLLERTISGNAGCNMYSTKIVNLTTNAIDIGMPAMTKKACIAKNMEAQYAASLSTISSYKVTQDNLTFYNADGAEVLAFFKGNKEKADYRINDIWLAARINGNPINRMVKTPRLEVRLSNMKILGNDGCNDYTGSITDISEKNIKIGNIAATQKACRNMETANHYHNALNTTRTYKIEEGKLTFYDKDNTETVSFLKVD